MESIVDVSPCLGKDSWPELVGKKGEEAVVVIEGENPFVHAIILLDGTPVTLDFRCDRVRVWVDECGYVLRPPVIT
ncbi:glu S.griseus protease inhibitor-like [Salvia hispanica]|uniref:glu S.griseus protease inhibitor-like n=1 Tax=Salvia hispanica TaxID=49212 RepID=UPI0020097453|nr:glu S.griseus protease inhibitor-like [Salvia hispanica]